MDPKRATTVSKFLSLVLRHEPSRASIRLDPAGWVEVGDLLAGCARAGMAITPEELDEVVRTNEKQRFAFSEDGLRIRASQGHSVEVELGYEPAVPPETLYHGTIAKFLDSIHAQGLLKGERHDVHLSESPETATAVGQRRGQPIILRVHAGRMHRDGHTFRRSANGVWLTDSVPAAYVSFPTA